MHRGHHLECQFKSKNVIDTPISILNKPKLLSNYVLMSYSDATRRFFLSKVEGESMKQKGTYEDKVTQQRRRNRVVRVRTYIPTLFTCSIQFII